MGVIPNQEMAFIFPISCILALIFPILIKYFPKCVGNGSFPKSQIKSLPFSLSDVIPNASFFNDLTNDQNFLIFPLLFELGSEGLFLNVKILETCLQ